MKIIYVSLIGLFVLVLFACGDSEVINTPVSPYIQNAPIAYCASTLESIYVDPGDEIEKLINVSNELNLKPQYIFITHGHIDHACGAV